MFPDRFFGPRYFAPRYFPRGLAVAGGGASDSDMEGKRLMRVPVYADQRQAEEDWFLEAGAAILILEDDL